MDNNSYKKKIQEDQYKFPYHYIPSFDNGNFSQIRYWSWGFRYLGGLKVVFDQLENMKFNNLVDVGCGDGRFLKEVFKKYPKVKLLGVDISKRAISFAKAMNTEIEFRETNITKKNQLGKYDILTLIETLEHIPKIELKLFINSLFKIINDGGYLILTVPHLNKGLNVKHYQHFNSIKLKKLLLPYSDNIRIVPFDNIRSKVLKIYFKAIGGNGKYFLISYEKCLNYFYNLYLKKYLYTNEKNCGRLLAICQKKKHIF